MGGTHSATAAISTWAAPFMMPAAFDYHAVDTVAEAADLLAKHGEDAKLLAGGQSLLAALKLRLAKPGILIDLGRLADLREIAFADGLKIGAMVDKLGKSAETTGAFQALRDAASDIGHPLIRNRGTFGGSLAHADPAGDWPALALAFEATIHVTNKSGVRKLPVQTFFTNLFTTALMQEDVLTHVELPQPVAGTSSAYVKIPHPASGYAVAGAAVVLTLDGEGVCRRVRIALTGVAATVFRAHEAEAMMTGRKLDPATIRAAADQAAASFDPLTDNYASAAYRRNLAGVVAHRAIMHGLKRTQS